MASGAPAWNAAPEYLVARVRIRVAPGTGLDRGDQRRAVADLHGVEEVGVRVGGGRIAAGPARHRRQHRQNCLCGGLLSGASHGGAYRAAALSAMKTC
jgi:hypothetical protein